jgi:hypothetical protein
VIGHREAALKHAQKQSRSVQDIAPLPPEPIGEFAELRSKCSSLHQHLRICYPNAFSIEFSDDHNRLIDLIEKACTIGQLQALAMPRGSGKTTIFLRAALWALLERLRRFCVLIAATEAAATSLLKTIKIELQTNEMLHALYPRETYALRRLEGEARLAGGQRFNGKKTHAEWRADLLHFGNIDDVATSGAMLSVCGLTGALRGQQVTLASGEVLRPDIVFVDDWQTKESAASPTQCQTRYELMMADVLGMAGPNQTIAAIATGTVIYRRDGMDRLLDRKASPQWRGDRCQLVYSWPDDEKIWDQYRGVHEAEMNAGGDGSKSKQFVLDHFDQMHKGSRVGWLQRFNENEASALQHAYNLRFRDEAAFWAEYQNAPLTAAAVAPFELDADEIASRTNRVQRNEVPIECEKITAFVDIQKSVLFYVVVAWEIRGRGHVIDYGTWPDQRRLYFSKSSIVHTLQAKYGTDSLNEALAAGLEELVDSLFARKYERQTSAQQSQQLLRLDRLGIDARWGYSTAVVRRFCRETQHLGRVHPMMGQFIGKDNRPWHKWTHKRSDLLGVHCKMQAPPKNTRGVAELLTDVNWWKSFAAERLSTPRSSDKAILLFDSPQHVHRLFAEHCTAETSSLEVGKSGNKVIEFKQARSDIDNDFWDCLVGACVLASIEGVKVDTESRDASREQKPKKTPTQQQQRQTNRDDRISTMRW